MLIEKVSLPCAQCLGQIETAVIAIDMTALATIRATFCTTRNVGLYALIIRGKVADWHVWPADNQEQYQSQLASLEAAALAAAHAMPLPSPHEVN